MKGKGIVFEAVIQKFGNQGEKTGWRYVEIPLVITQQLFPGNKKSFRVSGKIDNFVIEKVALIPIGGGQFIMPLNAEIRKGIRKQEGQQIMLRVNYDAGELPIDRDLLDCLDEDKVAHKNFFKLTPGHRNYFSKWIGSAKTDATKARRIAMTLEAMVKGMDYGQMLRAAKK